MNFITHFCIRYFSGMLGASIAYVRWCESIARETTVLRLMVFCPIVLFAALLLALPHAISKSIAMLLIAPLAYLSFVALFAIVRGKSPFE